MSYIFEFVRFFFDTFWLFAKTNPLGLALSVLAGIGLAALCWFVTVFYTRLWNTRYRPGLVHHLLCGIAALITMLFTIAYFALGYAQQAAENRVAAWKSALEEDCRRKGGFSDRMMVVAYRAVQKSGLEDMEGFPPPGTREFEASSRYPENADGTRRLAAKLWAEAVLGNYKDNQQFLSTLVSPRRAPVEIWYNDEVAFRKRNLGNTYYVENGIEAVASDIRRDITAQAPRLIPQTRAILVTIFLFVQLIPFTLVGWGAYRDIKVMVKPQEI
jgi:hypothetical protein